MLNIIKPIGATSQAIPNMTKLEDMGILPEDHVNNDIEATAGFAHDNSIVILSIYIMLRIYSLLAYPTSLLPS